MNLRDAAADTLDVRPGEWRPLALATAGAFLVMSFVIAARSLRDAFFLDEFNVEQLPYMTAVAAVVGIPVVTAFTRSVVGRDAFAVYRRMLLGLAIGIVALQAAAWEEDSPLVLFATVGFYLWTALGSLLVTSGFWMITAERFELRNAKRLFGLIGAGGTLGATLAGLAMRPIGNTVGNAGLVASLWLMLLALWALQRGVEAMRGRVAQPAHVETAAPLVVDGFAAVARNAHLRTIAAIVAVSAVASYLVDYQFKAAAAATWQTDEQLAGFFGGFYGVTGLLGLLLQVLLLGPLLSRAGVGGALAVLPIVLLAGASFIVLLPGLLSVTAVRGADNALRRSLHRSVIEFLYVPLTVDARRRTKAFVDSLVDSAAEGGAALLVLLLVAAGMTTTGMSWLVMALAIVLLWLSRQMSTRYLVTLRERLRDRGDETPDDALTAGIIGGEVALPMATFDMQDALQFSGVFDLGDAPAAASSELVRHDAPAALIDRLASAEAGTVSAALSAEAGWGTEHAPALVRLLARDAFSRRAGELLVGCGEPALPVIQATLLDEDADFVIRRRLPAVLARIDAPQAAEVLLRGLSARRFEVRYRCGVGLAHRRAARMGLPSGTDRRVWAAIQQELSHDRPVWELQQLLDEQPYNDAFVVERVSGRGALSLEHTFRLLSLVLDETAVRMALYGVTGEDASLRGLSLEYLEHVLPVPVRQRLWPFIGDLSEQRRRRQMRPVDQVVGDLLKTGTTLFGNVEERERLRQALADSGLEVDP